jgi:hypothetical protein
VTANYLTWATKSKEHGKCRILELKLWTQESFSESAIKTINGNLGRSAEIRNKRKIIVA